MIGRRSILAGLTVALMAGASPPRKAPPKPVTPVVLDCGPVALYALLRLEGRPTPIEDVAAKLPAARPGGFSMKELRDASRALGLDLDGVYLARDEGVIDRPMLAFLKVEGAGHFLVVRPVGHTGKLVQVIESNQPPRVIDKADLVGSDQWTGIVLNPRRTNRTVVALASLVSAGLGVLGLTVVRIKRKRAATRAIA